MIDQDFMRVVVQFDVPGASNPAIMRFDFQLTSTTDPFVLAEEGPNIRDTFIARYFIPLESVISNGVVMTQLDLRAFAHPDDGYTAVGSLWQGDNAFNMLPPANTLAFRLARNNFTMRNGRKAFPGPTSNELGPGGRISTAAADALAIITTVWTDEPMLVEGTGTDMVFSERIVREPTTEGVNPTVWSTVSWGRAYFGTQNSRKG